MSFCKAKAAEIGRELVNIKEELATQKASL